ncbi:BppU family phage baseplate upper protein [Clostridium perfringens]|nr:BppU family phage baseplate upper protein [Clostridium perfringens]MDM0716529.1 BppU family phage baseplate upper protein [Clostridium perfringens]
MKEIIINVDSYNENSIKTIEGDNLSEVYKIYICKNKRRIDLTNKIAIMAYVNEYGNKKSNILALNITNASQGEIELPITNVISSENGVYACQIAIYGENNSLEQTAPFSLIVENNIFSKISNSAINSSDFHILSEAIKTTNSYAKKLKEGTENIELQYAKKLNEKLDKDGIVTMANMGQDVKEAMTGGSVAVVGKDAVDTINLRDKAVTKEKISEDLLETIKNIDVINNSFNKVSLELNFFNVDLKNGAEWLKNNLIIREGNTGAYTKINYNSTSKCEIDQSLYFIAIVERSEQLGSLGFNLKAKRNNSLVAIPLIETKVNFLSNTNKILYINKFNVLKGDSDFNPSIVFTNDSPADKDVTYSFERIALLKELDFELKEMNTKFEEINNKFKETSNNFKDLKNNFSIISEKNNDLEEEVFKKNIYHNFSNISNEKVEVLNGATKINNSSFEIPKGSTGENSYIGADLYLTGSNPRKVRIYSVLNISDLTTFKKEDVKFDIFIPKKEGGYDNITPNTNYQKINENVCIIYCDYDYLGSEEYLKTRIQLKSSKITSSNTIIYSGGFCYSFEKSNDGTINKAFTDSIQVMINKSIEKIKFPEIQTPKKELLFNGMNSKFNSITKTIVDNDVLFEIIENYNTTFRVFGVKEEKEYLLPLINLSTGTTSKEAVYCTKYKVVSDGFSEFRFERNPNSSEYGELIAYLLPSCNDTPVESIGDYNNYIDKEKIKNIVKTCPNISTYGVRNGKILGTRKRDGMVEVLESDSYFNTFNKVGVLPNATDHPSHVEICGDNSVILISRTGQVFRTEDLINYTQVLDIRDNIYAWGGFTQLDSYNNIVLLSEYRLPAKHHLPWAETNGGGKLYLSEDFGKTFKAIFDIPINYADGGLGTHIHAIKYDPYENIIWLVTGDGVNHQMIWYSLDKGENWYKSVDFKQSVIQMTAIYPLRNCVLFASDGRLVSVARYNRPKCGTMAGIKMNFDCPIILAEGWGKAGNTNVPVGSRGAIDYKNSKVYFGFLGAPYIHTENTYGILKNGEIFATDGYTTELVFKNDTQVDYGVIAVYEDFSNNKAIGKLGREGKFVEINTDIWYKN